MPPKACAGAPVKKVRRKERKNVAHGQAHIKSTFNNTIVSITDPTGAGDLLGLRRPSRLRGLLELDSVRRAARRRGRRVSGHGARQRKVHVFVKGLGSGRVTAFGSLQAVGLKVGLRSPISPPLAAERIAVRRSVVGSYGE